MFKLIVKGLCRIENSIIDKDPSFEEGCDLVEPIVDSSLLLLQLLLATKTPADRKEKMWSQIESEMCLQRSKTIAQMCKTKQVTTK